MKKSTIFLSILIGLFLIITNPIIAQNNLPYTQGHSYSQFNSISETGTHILNSTEELHTYHLQLQNFSFNFNGIVYSDFYINSSGWISLGIDATNETLHSNDLVSLGEPVLTPLWDKFNLLEGDGSTYIVYYKTETISNENVLTIEWHNMEWMDYAANFLQGAKINFQIKLYQTSKRIEFLYQSPDAIEFMYDPTAGLMSENSGASIGISDANYNPIPYSDENFSSEAVQQNSYEHFNDKLIYFEYSGITEDTTEIAIYQTAINVYPNEQNKSLLNLTLGVHSGDDSKMLNQIKFSLNGTNSLFDIQNVQLFYSTSNNIAEAELKSSIPVISTDSLNFNFSNFELNEGLNYFWLTVDINQNAIEGNLIDASLAAIKLGDVYKNIHLSPSGSLLILNNTSFAGRGILPSGTVTNADYARNWTEQTSYNEDGSILSVSRTYFDNLGRTTQQQNNTGGTIIVNQIVYDLFGRTAIQTLPAVRTNETSIIYDNNFITNGNSVDYSYTDFDLANKKYSPNAIKSTNTLASYYNNSNILEPYVASSNFPYSRIDYVGDVTSRIQTQTLAGEEFKLGSTHQTYSFDMLSAGELTYVYGAYRSYVQDNIRTDVLNFSSELAKANKVVTIDADKKVNITFYGPNNIMVAKCLSGILSNGCVSQQIAQTIIFNPVDKNKYTNSIDIHLPKSKSSSLNFSIDNHPILNYTNLNFELYDLLNKKKLVYGTDFTIAFTLGKYNVQFLSNQYLVQDKFLRFSVNLGQNSINWNQYKKENKLDCFINLNYELDYSNWTANYYDSKLNLISSIQPKDIDCNYNPLSGLNNIKGSNLLKASSILNTQLTEIGIPSVTENDRQIKFIFKPILDMNNIGIYANRQNPTPITSLNVSSENELLEIFNKNEVADYGTLSDECLREVSIKPFFKKKLQLYFNIYGAKTGGSSTPELISTMAIWFTLTGYTVKDCNIAKYKLENNLRKNIGFDNAELKDFDKIFISSNGIKVYDEYNDQNMNDNSNYIDYNDLDDSHKYIYDPFSITQELFNIVKLNLVYELNTYPHTSLLNYSSINKNVYDDKSRLIVSTSEDEGKTMVVYNQDNQVRFTQNELQSLTGKFSYVNYDKSGRVVETGEYDPNLIDENGSLFYFFQTEKEYSGVNFSDRISVISIVNSVGSFNAVRCTNRSFIAYDVSTGDLPTNIGSAYVQKNLAGRITKTWNDENITWYSYEYDGKLSWIVQGQSELGTKTIDYTYNFFGNIITTEYQKGINTERLKHIYTYDNYLRLLDVSTVRGSANTPKLQARYSYYKHGPLKRKELGNKIQGVDYVYTINGWIKSINEPSLSSKDPGKDGYSGVNSLFKKDVFGMTLDYFNNDYVRAGSFIQNQINAESAVNNYDGKVKSVTWKTMFPPNGGNDFEMNMLTYLFNYDQKGQLSSAIFGTNSYSETTFNSSTINVTGNIYERPEYKVFNITYDRNGNIATLNRNGNTNVNNYLKDNLSYNYSSNSGNRLISVTDYSTDIDAIDFVPSNSSGNLQYEYDEIGRMITDYTKNVNISYNLLGKVSEIREIGTNNIKIKYNYNERGNKIRKTVYPDNENTYYLNVTHYLNDVSGNVIAIYTDSRLPEICPKVNLEEQTIFGSGRIGVIYARTNQTVYELTDHLGNVRATVSDKEDGVNAELLSYTDYYPHGSVMPGRSYTSSNQYRYDYQGVEKDRETNWNNFELRMYDPNLGRWMSPDPYGQYFSPYLAMGNNPVSMIDPDGGRAIAAPTGEQPEGMRKKRVDPFDMVGGGGTREEYYHVNKEGRLEQDPGRIVQVYELGTNSYDKSGTCFSSSVNGYRYVYETSAGEEVIVSSYFSGETFVNGVMETAQGNGEQYPMPQENGSDGFYTQLQKNAAIEALVLLGFDRTKVSKDVKAADRYSAKLSNIENYTTKMRGGYFDSHSISFNAYQSGTLSNTLYAVKIYENGNISIVYSNLIDHVFEATAEVMEMGLGKIGLNHYMHERNAIGFMNSINKLKK